MIDEGSLVCIVRNMSRVVAKFGSGQWWFLLLPPWLGKLTLPGPEKKNQRNWPSRTSFPSKFPT